MGDLSEANALIVVPAEATEVATRQPGPGARAGPGLLTMASGAERRLTHVDETGAARMVDVSGKEQTVREAVATGRVLVSAAVVDLLRGEGVPKGDALGVARVAGIMAAKRTPDLVPLCHPLAISGVTVDLTVADDAVEITATVRTTDRTGVEMEALTAVSVAALTVVDMVKAVDKAAVITDVRVESKTGGKSGDWVAAVTDGRAADGHRGVRVEPRGGRGLRGHHRAADRRRAGGARLRGHRPGRRTRRGAGRATRSVPPSTTASRAVITTGGTGPDPDRPDARGHPGTARLRGPRHRRGDPGVRRRAGRARPRRCRAGWPGSSAQALVVNLPGSRGGVKDGLAVLTPMLVHAVQQIAGSDH